MSNFGLDKNFPSYAQRPSAIVHFTSFMHYELPQIIPQK